MENRHCAILVPAVGAIEPHCEFSLRQLESLGYPVRRLYGFSAIDVARNRLATDALADGFEELMWIDSDIAFEPGAVERLRSHNLPIACGLYPKKGERHLASSLPLGTSEVVFGEGGGLLEVTYAATGFLHTRREIYLEIVRRGLAPTCNAHLGLPMIPFFLPLIVQDDRGRRYLSEDFAFCERLRHCGYRIFADSTIRLQHIGIYGYSWEDLGGALPRSTTYHLSLREAGTHGEGPASPAGCGSE